MIFPISDEMRERINRRQSRDRDAWDCVPAKQTSNLLPFDQRRNRPTQGHQSVCARPAAKLSGNILLVSFAHHDLLDCEPLLSFATPNVEQRGQHDEREGA